MTHTHTARNKTTLAEFLVRKFSDTEIFFTNRKNFIFKWDFLHHSRMENKIKHASPPQNKKQVGCKRDFLVYPSERETDTSVSPPQKEGGGNLGCGCDFFVYFSERETNTNVPQKKKGGGKDLGCGCDFFVYPSHVGSTGVPVPPTPCPTHTDTIAYNEDYCDARTNVCLFVCVCVGMCVWVRESE